MNNYYSARALGAILVQAGVLPANCRDAELVIPVNGALMLHCNFFVTDEDIPKIQKALGDLLESSRRVEPAAEVTA